MELPWAPLYTVMRSERPELTVYGMAYVWAEDQALCANAGRSLLKMGDVHYPLWARSLLKPWQLMVVYPTLRQAHPQLTDEHFALMMASHQGEARQQTLLGEILEVGQLEASRLQCPACRPMKPQNASQESRLHHPCSGKHLAHLLYLKAKGQALESYLQPDAEPHRLLRELLAYLLNREFDAMTVDGCGMPNEALSAVELTQLYHALVMPVSKAMIQQSPPDVEDALASWDDISRIMREQAELLGGPDRLDTRLMQGTWQQGFSSPVVAKEGADGLLAAGMGPTPATPNGLGLLIKLSSGYQASQLETLINAILRQLGLTGDKQPDANAVLQTTFHFQVNAMAASQS